MIKLPLFYVLSIACFTSMSVALPDVKKKGGFRKPRSLKVKTKHARTELQKVLRVPNNPRDQSPSAPVSVQAILVPRSISIRFFIQLSCILSLLFSLMNCLQTAGIPHIRAIWELISEDGSVMPKHYRPTSFDIHFARIIAANTNEIVPPIGIPSARPLFGFCASIVVYVGSTILLPCWFTPIRVFLDYKKLQAVSPNLLKENTAASVLVHINDKNIQQDLAGTSEDNRRMAHSSFLCKLKPSYEVTGKPKKEARDINRALGYSHPSPFYFEVNQCRFYFDPTNRTCLGGGPLLQAASLRDLEHLSRDGLSKSQRMVAEERYRPYNQPKLATPTIHEAFLTRISSPLVIVQLLGRLLSVLEDGSRALTNTMFTLAHHYINSRQAIISARQMAKEVQTSVQDTSSMKVMVLKNRKKKKWVPTTASKLIPGDIFTMSVNNNGDDFLVIPIDSLLLDGQGLVNEAVLTGESVPQSKMPIDFEEEIRKRDAILDLHDHRCSILFAGTTMVHCSSDGANEKSRGQSSLLPSRNEPRVTCLALRTGTYSSKGQLLQALKSSTHVGAISNAQSEKDAMRLIASLSVFAVASCISLFIPPRGHNRGATVSVFRRIIQCTRIAIASIPSDLPLALSSVARSCSKKLRRESDVICSEPGSLLTAAYVDTVVFDKTGTLTADTQTVSKLVSQLPKTKTNISSDFQRFILAGCHSLVQLNTSSGSRVAGDPLDQASLKFSRWKYNQTAGCYSTSKIKSLKRTEPVKLWQIKTFPFDPNKRLSSALVLAQSADKTFSLWRLTKGSPDTMNSLYSQRDDAGFNEAYCNKTQTLEANGLRSIALGAEELSASLPIVNLLFPNGLSNDFLTLRHARSKDSLLHRSDFEAGREGGNTTTGLKFCGFSCFDAFLRPSSRRVVNELHRGGIQAIMLTGDAIDAALVVARKVGLMKERNVAILETKESTDGHMDLIWRIVKLQPENDASFRTFHESSRIENVTVSSTKDVLSRQRCGSYAVAATGLALEIVLNEGSGKPLELLADNLSRMSVIARATPNLKKAVITCLRSRCGKKVLMCGDGVNDVAAMKHADVAVALLNGFGAETDGGGQQDIDDKRRKKKLMSLRIGCNRQKSSAALSQREEAQERMKNRIEKYQDEVKRRSAARYGKDPNSTDVNYEMQDLKAMVSATMQAVSEERRRARSLKVGGGDAARILAKERQNRSECDMDDDSVSETIKPGEASLVASFSCLHPSIDGVDSILRAGVATAACALATQERIALHSLMACYHLATLYRDGFRYGKNMWPVELFMYQIVESAGYIASCTPRPRLPPSRSYRPSESMFDPACIFFTVAQAATHLAAMAIGVNYGRRLERVDTLSKVSLISLAEGSRDRKISKLLGALADRQNVDDQIDETMSIFRRPQFRANYETNVVFIFSILQSAVASLTNHRGKPFHRSILESRELCFAACATLLFSTVCIAENFPFINGLLELRPMPSRKSKFIILSIAMVDVLVCIICRIFSEIPLKRYATAPKVNSESDVAADLEEKLLEEESKQNFRGVFMVFGLLAFLVLEIFSKD